MFSTLLSNMLIKLCPDPDLIEPMTAVLEKLNGDNEDAYAALLLRIIDEVRAPLDADDADDDDDDDEAAAEARENLWARTLCLVTHLLHNVSDLRNADVARLLELIRRAVSSANPLIREEGKKNDEKGGGRTTNTR